MDDFDSFLDEVDKGRKGENRGLSTGKKKLDDLIGGLQRATYYAVGGEPGTGKTALVDDCFILNPYADFLRQKNNKDLIYPVLSPKMFYYSFEISKKRKIAKWVCHLLYERHKIIISPKDVFSKINILSDDLYEKVKLAKAYIEGLLDYIYIHDTPINPTGIFKDVANYMNSCGRIDEIVKEINGYTYRHKIYTPNNPHEIVVIILDHVGLIRRETDFRSKKEIIDKMSEYTIQLRNFYGVSTIAVSQFNRELGDLDRRRFSELSPQLGDFKNTGNLSEDAEIVMTIFNPLRYNIVTYSNLNIMNFGGRFRSTSILKNREGDDMIKLNLNFMGEAGHFRQFPDPMLEHQIEQAKRYEPFR